MSFLFGCVVGAALFYAGQKYHFYRLWKRAVAEYKAGGTSSDD